MTAETTPEAPSISAGKPPPLLLKRPSLLVATFLIPGIIVGYFVFPRQFTVWLLVPLGAFFLVSVWLLMKHSTFSMPASMLVVFWVGVLLGVKSWLLPPGHVHFKLEPEKTYCLRGVVVAEPVAVRRTSRPWARGQKRVSFTFNAERVREPYTNEKKWEPVRGKLLVYASSAGAAQLRYGDGVELTGEAFLPAPRRNPGGFDFRRYLAQDDIYLCMRADSIRRYAADRANPFLQALHSLKRKIRRSFSASSLREHEESFLSAVVLGERRGMDEEFREALVRTGTAHILAISGLHVGILAGAMYFFLSRLFFVPHSISSLMTMVVLFAYAFLTGMRPPVMRASLMCTSFLIAPLLKKRLDSINSLAFAAVVILFLRPADLFTAGFQLSFMVVLSILLLSNRIFRGLVSVFRLRPDPGFLTISPFRRWLYRRIEWPLRLFSVALAAFLGSLPLTLCYFNSISFLSPFCNMAVIPLVGFIVPFGFLAGLVGLLWQGAADLINAANGELIGALQAAAMFFSGLRIASFNVSPPSSAFCIAFYCLLLLLGFARSFRHLFVPIFLVVVLVVILFVGKEMARRHPDSIEITFLDVGQGDCAFVEFPDGRKMLVDGGSADRSEIGRYVIVPFLRWAGVNRLDAILISHYDSDHISGLRTVLEDMSTRAIVVRAGPQEPDTSLVENLLRTVKKKRITTHEVRAGNTLHLSNRVAAKILNPHVLSDSARLSENDLSVVLNLNFRGSSVLLCGDIEKKAEQEILRRSDSLRADLLKVPHHGSDSSSSDEFLRRAAPKVAVISCGAGNIYGHPSPKTLERYSGLGVRVFRTDQHGGIVVRVFRRRLSVTTTL